MGFPAKKNHEDWASGYDKCYMQGFILKDKALSAGLSGAVGAQFSELPDISKLTLGSTATEPLRPAPLGDTHKKILDEAERQKDKEDQDEIDEKDIKEKLREAEETQRKEMEEESRRREEDRRRK